MQIFDLVSIHHMVMSLRSRYKKLGDLQEGLFKLSPLRGGLLKATGNYKGRMGINFQYVQHTRGIWLHCSLPVS